MTAVTTQARPRESAKREAILDAALELFCERTFDGTPVPQIAERAGVGAGTIYRYFASKEALVNAVYRRWKNALGRALVEQAPKGVPAREEFAHWWRALWRFASEQPRAFAFLETHHHQAYLDEESVRAGEAISEGARAFVLQAQRAGEVRRGNADVLIALVFGAFTGLVKAAGPAGLRADERTIRETEECAWAMLRAENGDR